MPPETDRCTTQCHRLAPHHLLTLSLTEGSTLMCAEGAIQLTTSALACLDGSAGYTLALHTGQSWRAPGAVWVQVCGLHATARVQVQTMPAQKNRPSQFGMGRLVEWVAHWRGWRSAPAVKRGQRVA